MAVLNNLTLEGRLTSDTGEVSTSNGGNKYIRANIATNMGKDKKPMFMNVIAMGYEAERLAKTPKGTKIIVQGGLTPNNNKEGAQIGVNVLADIVIVVPKEEKVVQEKVEETAFPWD